MKTYTGVSSTSIYKVSWEKPSFDGGTALIGYKVEIEDKNGDYQVADSCSGSTSLSCDLTYD